METVVAVDLLGNGDDMRESRRGTDPAVAAPAETVRRRALQAGAGLCHQRTQSLVENVDKSGESETSGI
jgi:hypothetical protein